MLFRLKNISWLVKNETDQEISYWGEYILSGMLVNARNLDSEFYIPDVVM